MNLIKKLLSALSLCALLILNACCSEQKDCSETAESTKGTIYEIAGTSPGISGQTWETMQAWRRQSVQYARRYRNRLYINAETTTHTVYLTFDDGPGSQNTPIILDILTEHDAAATFFCTGISMQAYPDILKQIADRGFTIGLHGWDHRRFTDMPAAEIARQTDRSNDLLLSLTGVTASITRPPYGAINETVIETLAAQDHKIYLWSIDTLDWGQKDPQDILRNIQENLRPGDIILMHCGDGQPQTARILPEIIEYILLEGYSFGRL
ncbi:MAG: polysaccharide deacetylase family protein [Peptococcaceae bacterium]|nr:polysaccharide deacetylase family protein [Peptococcaceae bacterium]